MAMPDPKHIAALIVGRAKPAGMDASAGPDQSDDSDDGAQAAAEDMLQAIDQKDPAALASAMQSLVQMCMNK